MTRRGTLELGINTIVLLIIAIVVLGLGVSFVIQVFTALDPEVIELDVLVQVPDATSPLTLMPSTVNVKTGEETHVDVGVYNAAQTPSSYSLSIKECTDGIQPNLRSLSQEISANSAAAYRVIIGAFETEPENRLVPGSYICTLQAQSATGTIDKQFTFTVLS